MKTLIINLRVFALITIMALGMSNVALAQNNTEKIKAMQVAIMTDKLSLSPDESKAFWPVYNDYQAELKAIKKQLENLKGSPEEKLAKRKDLQQKKLDVQNNYEAKFRKIMSVDKVAQIDQAEREFKRWLVDQLKKQIP